MIICPNLKHPDVAREFGELKEATSEKAAYHIWSANNGNSVDKAPNGAESILFKNLLLFTGNDRVRAIRLKSEIYKTGFKKKYGDWTTGKTQKQMFLDENGEPTFDSVINSDIFVDLPHNKDVKSIIEHAEGYVKLETTKKARANAAHKIKNILDALYGLKLGYYIDKDTKEYRFRLQSEVKEFDYLKTLPISDRNRIEDIIDSLNDVFTVKFNIQWIEPGFPPPHFMKVYDNAIIHGNTIYLRTDKATTEIVAEEMLHTFIYNIKRDNPKLYEQLLHYSKQRFKEIDEEVKRLYVDDEGNPVHLDEELVTKVLARHYAVEERGNQNEENHSIIARAFATIRKYFKKCPSINNFIKRRATTVDNIKDFTSFHDLVKILMSKLILFRIRPISEGEIYKNINNVLEKESTRRKKLIILLFKSLDKTYSKLRDKSESQTLYYNKIHEHLTDLMIKSDIEAVSESIDFALLTIGVFDVNTLSPQSDNTILGYLYKQSQDQMPFLNVSVKNLHDLYKNNIRFYNALLNEVFNKISIYELQLPDIVKLKELQLSLNNVNKLYKQALYVVSDKIADDYIDKHVTAETEDKENMKLVFKDWLHRNMMHEDISSFLAFTMNNAYIDNPVIKQAFHMIQIADQKTRTESIPTINKILHKYYKLNSVFRHPLNNIKPNFQKVMIEYIVDKNGSKFPSGNFVREYNYGQAEYDFQEKLIQLNKKMDELYGYHYIFDEDLNTYVRSSDRGDAYDEDYEHSTFVEYLKEIEKIKCSIYNRRYTEKYYLERLSKPFDYTDPHSIENNHGLRPSTIRKLDYIQSNINFYLKKCVDPETGFSHPEKLSKNEMRSLQVWYDKLEDLQSPYDEIGDLKSEDEARTAFELQAWNSYVQLNTISDYDEKLFYKEVDKIKDPDDKNAFIYFNSTFKTDPRLFKPLTSVKNLGMYQVFKTAMLNVVRVKNDPLGANIEKISTNTDYFINLKKIDLYINDHKSKLTKAEAKYLSKVGDTTMTPYTKDGKYFDNSGKEYTRQQYDAIQKLNKQTDENHPRVYFKTWFDVILQQYIDYALNNNGAILNLLDDDGNLVYIKGSDQAITEAIKELFLIDATYLDKDGNEVVVKKPLSVFSTFVPVEGFKVIPTGRFSKKQNKNVGLDLINDDYDYSIDESSQPIKSKYKNSQYDRLNEDKEIRELYDLLLSVYNQSRRNVYGNLRTSYKFPLLNKNVSQIISNIINIGFKPSINNLWNAFVDINNNDYYIKSSKEYELQTDGTVSANDLNIRYESIDNKLNISEDIVSAVLLYYIQSIDYKNKQLILSTIETYQQALDQKNRGIDLNGNTYSFGSSENSLKVFKHMMDAHVFRNRFDFDPNTLLNKRKTFLKKIGIKATNLLALNMLGLNFISMGTGWYDSITRQLQDVLTWKYSTPRDMLDGIMYQLAYQIPQLLNYGKILPNNKQSALMQRFGVLGDIKENAENVNVGRIMKTFRGILMLGFLAVDYLNNSILLSLFLSNCRFYSGDDVIKPGFYTRYQLMYAFKNAGRSKKDGAIAHMMCMTTLRNAYVFNPRTHELSIKPQYQQYIDENVEGNIFTKIKNRQSLINGINPDNDRPIYKDHKYGKFLGAMRGWLTQIAQDLLAGADDVSVRSFHEEDEQKIVNDKEVLKAKKVLDKKTLQLRARAFSYNYETGASNNLMFKGVFRTFESFFRRMKYAVTLDFNSLKNEKLSTVDRNAWGMLASYIAVLLAITFAYKKYHDWANTVYRPSNVMYHVRPRNILDIPRWVNEDYIGRGVYTQTMDAVMIRTIQSKLSQQNPHEAIELVHEMSVLNKGFLDINSSMYGIATKSFDDDFMDKVIKRTGKYKNFTNREKLWYTMLGAPDNLVSSFTEGGLKSNREYYGNMMDWYFDLTGILYKNKKPTYTNPTEEDPFNPTIDFNEGFGTDESFDFNEGF